jgi:hypothetical protein
MNNTEKHNMMKIATRVGFISLILGIISAATSPLMFTGNGFLRFGLVLPVLFLWFSWGCYKYRRQLKKELQSGKEDKNEDTTIV